MLKIEKNERIQDQMLFLGPSSLRKTASKIERLKSRCRTPIVWFQVLNVYYLFVLSMDGESCLLGFCHFRYVIPIPGLRIRAGCRLDAVWHQQPLFILREYTNSRISGLPSISNGDCLINSRANVDEAQHKCFTGNSRRCGATGRMHATVYEPSE